MRVRRHFALIAKVQEAAARRAARLVPQDLRGGQGEGAAKNTHRSHSSRPQPPFSQKYCLPEGSRAVFAKQSPINRLGNQLRRLQLAFIRK